MAPDGRPGPRESTLAENIGRGGVQVLTAMPSLAVGDIVSVTERGGDFQARAAVRSAYIGPDRIRRVNLEFLDRQAPDRLVPAEDASTGTRQTPAARSARPPTAAFDAAPAPTRATPVPTPTAEATPAPVPVETRSADELYASVIEPAAREALDLLEQERTWEAIQVIEKALPQARTPVQRHMLQVVLARAVLKNPKWLRRGEDLLLEVIRENPRHVAALLMLARLYRQQRMRARAERLLRQVLDVDPRNTAAAEELKALASEPRS